MILLSTESSSQLDPKTSKYLDVSGWIRAHRPPEKAKISPATAKKRLTRSKVVQEQLK